MRGRAHNRLRLGITRDAEGQKACKCSVAHGAEFVLQTMSVQARFMDCFWHSTSIMDLEHGVEKVISDMEAAFLRKDVEGLVALFAADATVESYFVTRIFGRKEGVCHGCDEIRKLVGAILEHGTPWGGHAPPIIRGSMAAVEYTTKSSDSEKFSVDIIEVKDGKIQNLRAYAGWRPMTALTSA
jgi:hypothetical protein